MPKINEILIEKLTNMWKIWTYYLGAFMGNDR